MNKCNFLHFPTPAYLDGWPGGLSRKNGVYNALLGKTLHVAQPFIHPRIITLPVAIESTGASPCAPSTPNCYTCYD